MEKCKFTKRYFNDQVVMFRISHKDFVMEKFYHIADDHEIHEEGKDTYHPIFTIIYDFIRGKNNQKNYWYAKAVTAFGEDKMINMFTTRLEKIRNRVLKQLWEKSAMITMATGYVLDKKEITDE
jgi:hypothetical protein|nr:MAG TPA: hypothetical protein [Caudoviricetes sp.]